MTITIPPTINACYADLVAGGTRYYAFIATPDKNYIASDVSLDAIFLKRIVPSDVSYGILRYDWEYGKVYNQYNFNDFISGTLKGTNFYVNVFNDGVYRVYKCINNNQGAVSTISPATINRDGVVTLADGYTWIFMYEYSISEYNKFSTNQYIPCQNNTQASAGDTSGSIDNIQIKNSGYGYTYCLAYITGDGFNATATVELLNGSVHRIPITAAGYDYSECVVTLVGNGSGASAVGVISPTGGQAANALTELYSSYLLYSVTISNDEDYDLVPYGVTYSSYGLLGNIGYAAHNGDSAVDYVLVNNGGGNYYQTNPIPSIVFGGGFDPDQVSNNTNITASAHASMGQSSITRVIVDNSGKNYRTAPEMAITNSNGMVNVSLSPVMKSVPMRNFISLNVSDTNLVFEQKEIIIQGTTTAQVLFHDTKNNTIGLYNVNGTFVGNTIVEGIYSGASATTLPTNYLNSPETTFTDANLIVQYTNSTITRQIDQPEKINIALSF